ncbi:MAG TPA: hypothetical protein HPQ00_17610, partial [Magnetococcales bacterium]|nr:hypothetical protein [Magnetococcales bacterium]
MIRFRIFRGGRWLVVAMLVSWHPAVLCAAGTDAEKSLDELRRVVEEGRRTKAARPEFLEKLDKILDRTRVEPEKPLLVDRFDDGDYDTNPAWTVMAGRFYIDGGGALFSSQARTDVLPMQTGGMEPDEKADPDIRAVMGIVGMLADSAGQGNNPQSGKAKAKIDKNTAVIHVPVATPNTFLVRFSFRSDASQGEGEVGLYHDLDIRSGYRLRLNADPNKDKTLEILRFNEAHHPESVAMLPGNGLGDGLNHELSWKRFD